METISGWLEYSVQNVGSKSEGYYAILKCENDVEYILYRSGKFPMGDEFFSHYNGQRVTVTGKAEVHTGYFCVHTIIEEGKEIEQPKTFNGNE